MGMLSLQAIEGVSVGNTLKIRGLLEDSMFILLDSGRSHSFLDGNAMKWVKHKVVGKRAFTVMVANGQKVFSNIKCPEVSWIMQGYSFCYNFQVIELGGYNIILEIN